MQAEKFEIKPYAPRYADDVIALWEKCNLTVPWNDPAKDIVRKLDVDPELFLAGFLSGKLVATAMGGYDGHRGWIYYLAVSPDHRKRGYGKLMVDKIESELKARGCPKINLQVRKTNTAVIRFYEKIGFSEDEVASFGKRLIPDTDDAVP